MSLATKLMYLGLVLVLPLAGACAAVRPRASVTGIGDANPTRDQNIADNYQDAAAGAGGVRVFVDSLPPGVEMTNGEIQLQPGYSHRLLAKFTLKSGHGKGLSGLRGFPDYRAGWKKGYCYPQTVLTYLTIFIWSILPPAYPCYGSAVVPKEDMVEDLKALGAAAGGDLVVAGYRGGDGADVHSAVGFILMMDPRFRGNPVAMSTTRVAPPRAKPAPAEQAQPAAEQPQEDTGAGPGLPGVPGLPGIPGPNVKYQKKTVIIVPAKKVAPPVVKVKVSVPVKAIPR